MAASNSNSKMPTFSSQTPCTLRNSRSFLEDRPVHEKRTQESDSLVLYHPSRPLEAETGTGIHAGNRSPTQELDSADWPLTGRPRGINRPVPTRGICGAGAEQARASGWLAGEWISLHVSYARTVPRQFVYCCSQNENGRE